MYISSQSVSLFRRHLVNLMLLDQLQDLGYPEAVRMCLNRLLTSIRVSSRRRILPVHNEGLVLCSSLVMILI